MRKPFTDYEGEQLLETNAKYHAKLMKKCPYKYEDINPKSGKIDVNIYCGLKRGKLCPNIDCICWYAKR